MKLVLLCLVFAGCAAKPFTGITAAQVRWNDAYWACHGDNSPRCQQVRAQFMAEDAYERQERQAADQRTIDEHRNQRRTAYIYGEAAKPKEVFHPQPLFPARTQANCTSTTYGNTVQTNCN